MKAIRDISLSLLAALYLMVVCATMICRITPLYAGFGPTQIASQACSSHDTPSQKSYVQHRHLPLVKQITIPVEFACIVDYPRYNHKSDFGLRYIHNVSQHACYFFFSISDRAPPAA